MGHSNKLVEDKDLIRALVNGDRRAFSEIYERYWRTLYNTVYKRTGDHNVTADILQDVFCSLWTRRKDLHIENLAAYLFRSVKFQTFKFLRRQQVKNDFEQKVILVDISSPSDIPTLEKEASQKLHALIRKLTPKQQEIFRLRYEEHKTPLQIAEIQNLSPKTVQNQLSLITVELKKKLFLYIVFPYLVVLFPYLT